MIFLFDNGRPGSEHRRAHVVATSAGEQRALARLDAALAADPTRTDAGLRQIMAKPTGADGPLLTVAEFLERPGRWRLSVRPTAALTDEHLAALRELARAWPAQRSVAPADLRAVEREVARRQAARRADRGRGRPVPLPRFSRITLRDATRRRVDSPPAAGRPLPRAGGTLPSVRAHAPPRRLGR